MVYSELTKKAMLIAYIAHEGQMDKAGVPYIFHPAHVAEQMDDEVSTAVALLHDVVEDTEYTIEDLKQEGFPECVVEAVAILTHKKNVPYLDYILEISKNPIAKKVKLADLAHNMDLSRLNSVDSNARKRISKYERAANILMQNNSI